MPSHKTATSAAATTTTAAVKSSSKNQFVAAMIKQGFLSDPLLSPTPSPPPSGHHHHHLSATLSPPASFTAASNNPTRLTNSSPTLFEMMSEEQARDSKRSIEARIKLQDRVFKVLADAPFQDNNCAGHLGPGDVKLTVSSCDGFSVSMEVHRRILSSRSRFFCEKLRGSGGQVCSAISFDDGILSCLEFLEAVPWSEEEEEKVVAQLGSLNLQEPLPHVLQRVAAKPSTSARARKLNRPFFNI